MNSMRMNTRWITGTLLLAAALTANAQMQKAPTPPPPNSPPPPAGGAPQLRVPPGTPPPPQAPQGSFSGHGTVRYVQRGERFVSNDRARTLVIPSGQSTSNTAQIEEDLNVMFRLLEKAANVADDPVRLAMGITLEGRIFGNSSGLRNMYLGGYGALIMLNVPYPLAPANAMAGTKETKETPKSEWEEARRELQAGGNRTIGVELSIPRLSGRFGAAQPFDQAKVDELKDNILKALKNAVHIQALRSDEWVTVVVTEAHPETPTAHPQGGEGYPPGPAPASRLVFQVKRSDLEPALKGTMDLEELRKVVKVSLQ